MRCCPKHQICPTSNVVDPPKTIYKDFYHPQIVNVIHNIEVVNRHHCVPVPRHVYCYSQRDEFMGPAQAMPTFRPGR